MFLFALEESVEFVMEWYMKRRALCYSSHKETALERDTTTPVETLLI
jgi:hypothetical protein